MIIDFSKVLSIAYEDKKLKVMTFSKDEYRFKGSFLHCKPYNQLGEKNGFLKIKEIFEKNYKERNWNIKRTVKSKSESRLEVLLQYADEVQVIDFKSLH